MVGRVGTGAEAIVVSLHTGVQIGALSNRFFSFILTEKKRSDSRLWTVARNITSSGKKKRVVAVIPRFPEIWYDSQG